MKGTFWERGNGKAVVLYDGAPPKYILKTCSLGSGRVPNSGCGLDRCAATCHIYIHIYREIHPMCVPIILHKQRCCESSPPCPESGHPLIQPFHHTL